MKGFSDNLQSLMGFYAEDAIRPMLGKTLESCTITDDKERIIFLFEDGSSQAFRVEGDCCSHSWIEHATGPDNLKGAKILDVTEQLMSDTEPDDEDSYEHIKVYQTSFRTDRGDIILEYRNSSNGYYGGYLVAA